MLKESNVVLKYKLSIEKQLYLTIRPVLVLSQLFGVAPLNINLAFSNNRIDNREIVLKSNLKCKILLYLHYAWCSVICVCIVTSIYFQQVEFDFQMPFLKKLLYLGEYFFSVWTTITIIFSCQYQRRWYRLHFQHIIEIDMKFKQCGLDADFGNLRKFVNTSLVLCAIFMSFVTVTDFSYNQFRAKDFFRSITVYAIPNVLTLLALIKYFCLLHILKERYRNLCTVLTTLCDHKDNGKFESAVLTVLPFQKLLAKRPSNETIINWLRKIYFDLSTLANDTNGTFGFLVISIVISTFLIVSIQLFAFYSFSEGPDKVDIALTVYSVLWVLLHGGKVYFILLYNQFVNNEKQKIAPILYQMEFVGTADGLANLELSLSKFSLQILHEKSYQTACGILQLDMTLLTTIVGSLTTYLVILIQFDSAANQQTSVSSVIGGMGNNVTRICN